jgi:hypothetical protein
MGNRLKASFIQEYVKRDTYHGVSRAFALKRAELTYKYHAREISNKEYHRQMDAVHAKYPEDWQKIQASSNS